MALVQGSGGGGGAVWPSDLRRPSGEISCEAG